MSLQWRTWRGPLAGPAVIVLGAVHGNEPCGAVALARLSAQLDAGALHLLRGSLTLVPTANALAHARGTRDGDRNLNRGFVPSAQPANNEDRIVAQLAPLLRAHDVLLDLHSFTTPGPAFAMVGPPNNAGPREPFARAGEELQLAQCLGVAHIIQGWLDVYDRAQALRGWPPDDLGVGTNEYMRSQGGIAVTLECGQHADPAAANVAERAVWGALHSLQMLRMQQMAQSASAVLPAQPVQPVRLTDVWLRQAPGDALSRAWQPFDAVSRGDALLRRADEGFCVHAPADGVVVFPNGQANVGEELLYLARRI